MIRREGEAEAELQRVLDDASARYGASDARTLGFYFYFALRLVQTRAWRRGVDDVWRGAVCELLSEHGGGDGGRGLEERWRGAAAPVARGAGGAATDASEYVRKDGHYIFAMKILKKALATKHQAEEEAAMAVRQRDELARRVRKDQGERQHDATQGLYSCGTRIPFGLES